MDALNLDRQNLTEDHALDILKEINDLRAKQLVPIAVFYVIIMMLGLFGNFFVIIVHVVRPIKIYIVCLASLDIIACIVGIPYHVLDLMNSYTYFYPITCKILTFLMAVPLYASMFMLAVVAIDRYLKLCKPLRRQQTNLESLRTCFITVSCSLIMASPYILIYGKSTVNTGEGNITGSQCFFDDNYTDTPFPIIFIGFSQLLFVVVTLVLTVLYIIIWRDVIKQEKYYNKLFKSTDANSRCQIGPTGLTLSLCMRLREKSQVSVESGDQTACETQMKVVERLECCIENNTRHSYQQLTVNSPGMRTLMADIESLEKSNVYQDNLCMSKDNTQCSCDMKIEGDTMKASLTRLPYGSEERSRSQLDNTNFTSLTQDNHEHRTKLTKIMFSITFVFIITYLPVFCISFLNLTVDNFWNDLRTSERILCDALLRFYLLNNMAKPFIYLVCDSRFRTKCIQLFKRLVCCFASSRNEDM